ncbi:unnamed protein product [Durusdinium trenchii]|uniref:Uncharacterized protein n=1 Tax=Durusdinium trenchii TaxID=1381693 RepID=A0ABP0IHA1_9DINO
MKMKERCTWQRALIMWRFCACCWTLALPATRPHQTGGETALILAARRGFVESARCLLKSGATRDHARTDRGATALHYAAGGGHLEFVILLVEHQASVDLEMTGLSAGMTAAHVASAAGRVEVLRWLLQNGATKALSPTPMSGLHMAADCSRLEVAHLLVEHLVGHRATLDGTMACGETALHLAAASGSVDIVWTEGTMEIEQCSGRLEWLDPMPREALETVLKSSLFPCGMDVCADQSGLPIDII